MTGSIARKWHQKQKAAANGEKRVFWKK